MLTYENGDIRRIADDPSNARTGGVKVASVELAAGERSWNPASTKRPISGPGKVDYTFFPDGGINTQLTPAKAKP